MEEFFTFREYMHHEGNDLTPSMEDYVEMIFRLSNNTGFTRINDIAAALNVQPSSVSRMIQKLAETGYLNYEKYGVVVLSEKGKQVGEKLIIRHNLSQEFLSLIGITEHLLEETEKIEHTLSDHTLSRIEALVAFFKKNPKILNKYKKFCEEHLV